MIEDLILKDLHDKGFQAESMKPEIQTSKRVDDYTNEPFSDSSFVGIQVKLHKRPQIAQELLLTAGP